MGEEVEMPGARGHLPQGGTRGASTMPSTPTKGRADLACAPPKTPSPHPAAHRLGPRPPVPVFLSLSPHPMPSSELLETVQTTHALWRPQPTPTGGHPRPLLLLPARRTAVPPRAWLGAIPGSRGPHT